VIEETASNRKYAMANRGKVRVNGKIVVSKPGIQPPQELGLRSRLDWTHRRTRWNRVMGIWEQRQQYRVLN
jgi:hypothetical protein